MSNEQKLIYCSALKEQELTNGIYEDAKVDVERGVSPHHPLASHDAAALLSHRAFVSKPYLLPLVT